jgi:hypothetical protein
MPEGGSGLALKTATDELHPRSGWACISHPDSSQPAFFEILARQIECGEAVFEQIADQRFA